MSEDQVPELFGLAASDVEDWSNDFMNINLEEATKRKDTNSTVTFSVGSTSGEDFSLDFEDMKEEEQKKPNLSLKEDDLEDWDEEFDGDSTNTLPIAQSQTQISPSLIPKSRKKSN